MSDVGTADEKKDKKAAPKPNDDKSYTEKVSVRRCESDTTKGKFLVTNPAKDVPAFKWEEEGKPTKYFMKVRGASVPTVGTEITDEAGKVWVVTRVIGGIAQGYSTSEVKEKPAEKKDEKPPAKKE